MNDSHGEHFHNSFDLLGGTHALITTQDDAYGDSRATLMTTASLGGQQVSQTSSKKKRKIFLCILVSRANESHLRSARDALSEADGERRTQRPIRAQTSGRAFRRTLSRSLTTARTLRRPLAARIARALSTQTALSSRASLSLRNSRQSSRALSSASRDDNPRSDGSLALSIQRFDDGVLLVYARDNNADKYSNFQTVNPFLLQSQVTAASISWAAFS
jgi:hypothetical protein